MIDVLNLLHHIETSFDPVSQFKFRLQDAYVSSLRRSDAIIDHRRNNYDLLRILI